MKTIFSKALPYLVLCACLLFTLPARPDPQTDARSASAVPGERRSFSGEALPLRPYLPDEAVWNASLGLWMTHPGLDIACTDVAALLPGEAEQVFRDRLWLWCVCIRSGDARVLYRSMESVCIKEGEAIAAGEIIGSAGCAPYEAELGPHVHLEHFPDALPADPFPLLQGRF